MPKRSITGKIVKSTHPPFQNIRLVRWLSARVRRVTWSLTSTGPGSNVCPNAQCNGEHRSSRWFLIIYADGWCVKKCFSPKEGINEQPCNKWPGVKFKIESVKPYGSEVYAILFPNNKRSRRSVSLLELPAPKKQTNKNTRRKRTSQQQQQRRTSSSSNNKRDLCICVNILQTIGSCQGIALTTQDICDRGLPKE